MFSSDSPSASRFAKVRDRDGVAASTDASGDVDRLVSLPGIRAYIYHHLHRHDDDLAKAILLDLREARRRSVDAWPSRIVAIAARHVTTQAAQGAKRRRKKPHAALPRCLMDLNEKQRSALINFYVHGQTNVESENAAGMSKDQFRRLKSRLKGIAGKVG